MKYVCEFRDIQTSLVQDAVQGRAVMNTVTSLWGLLCSEVTSPLNKDSAAMDWFNCAAIELRGGGVQILAEMRDFSLHDVQIGSGTLLASWFVGEEREKVFFF